MAHYKLALIGFGNVAQAFVRLLERKREALRQAFEIRFTITGIATGSHGCAVDPHGLDAGEAMRLVTEGRGIASLSARPVNDPFEVIDHSQADVMFENSPVHTGTGRPAIDYIRAALARDMHAITANKGPVVHACRELSELARAKGRKFRFEATVLGGAPLFSLFRNCFPLAEISSFRGILNSTTNIILSRMERGESYEDAVRYCRQVGVAETDPSNDVDGWDAAIKVAALATVLMGIPLTPRDIAPIGIRGITSEMIADARAEGKRYKLVCFAEKTGTAVTARVGPELLDPSSPLYHVMDSGSCVTFRTDVLPDYTITESETVAMFSGPDETAYGLFADFVNIARQEL